MEPVAAPYQEVQPHWFFCRRAEDDTSWLPFSREDSHKLENAVKGGEGVFILEMKTQTNIGLFYVMDCFLLTL